MTIAGGNGSDRLIVHAPAEGSLPTIFFDGGRGYDRAYVHGSSGDDQITLVESSSPAGLLPGVLGLNDVELLFVWARGGNDLVDAAGLETVRTAIFGGNGNDELIGGQARDVIFGGDDDDSLVGNAGNDRLFGGRGNDSHVGGPGRDFSFDIVGRNTFDDRPWWRWW